ncbi:MAG TPA: hypothetical protein VMF52_14740 [Steroidobacteraceae bacterium]|nr:hypothetical protein [Steroidobacteraceae bacterium]
MYRISIPAVVIAFLAEIFADQIVQFLVLMALAGNSLGADLDPAALQKVIEDVSQTTAFTLCIVVFGTATTLGGGYLAARIARQYPYYHGLAMGLVGIAFLLYFWNANPLWLSLLGVLTNIPVSIYGAHLAKGHMPPPE